LINTVRDPAENEVDQDAVERRAYKVEQTGRHVTKRKRGEGAALGQIQRLRKRHNER
jgi:hypothetical protein